MPCLVHITTVPDSLRALGGQLAFMKTRGMDVHVVSSPGPYLDAIRKSEDIKSHAIAMSRRITPFGDVSAVCSLVKLLRRIRPQIVHAHTPKAGLLGMLAAWIAGVPVRIYHIRGLRFLTCTGPKLRLLRSCDTLACRLATRVLCVSHSMRKIALQQSLAPASKVAVLLRGGHGTDANVRFNPQTYGPEARRKIRDQFGVPADATVVGYVGRIVRDKGIDDLIVAWKSLREQYPGLHLLVVGPFEDVDPIADRSRVIMRDDPRIHLVGATWDTAPFYAAMDMVCLPTYREGLPKLVLEAAAMGLPAVATRVPGCTDAVEDGHTGTLVEPRDAHGLAEAIGMYVKQRASRLAHGRAARERVVRDYGQHAMWNETLAEYSRLLRAVGLRYDVGPESTVLEERADQLAA